MKRYGESWLFILAYSSVSILLYSGCNVVTQAPGNDSSASATARTVPVQQLSPSPLTEGIYTGEITCSSLFTSSLIGDLSNATGTGPLTIVVGTIGIPFREPSGRQALAGLEFTRIDRGIVVNTDSVMIASSTSFLFGQVTLEGATTLTITSTDSNSLQVVISVLTIGVDGGEVFTLKDDCVGAITLSPSLPTS